MEDTLIMSNRELGRLKTIHRVLEGHMTWPEAARQLDLSERQIGRLCAGVRKDGPQGVIHGLRGEPSNHQLDPNILDRALDIVKIKYPDFGPTFANEKLLEVHDLRLSISVLRKGMIKEGLYKPRRTRRTQKKSIEIAEKVCSLREQHPHILCNSSGLLTLPLPQAGEGGA